MRGKYCLLITVGILSVSGQVYAAGDADHGKALYEEYCMECHSLNHNGVGPAHKGVFGRHAGLAPGYPYSKALRDSSVVWNEATLDRWLTGPDLFIPGAKMGFNVSDAKERSDLIAYLKRISGK